jgi:hypothetical protein
VLRSRFVPAAAAVAWRAVVWGVCGFTRSLLVVSGDRGSRSQPHQPLGRKLESVCGCALHEVEVELRHRAARERQKEARSEVHCSSSELNLRDGEARRPQLVLGHGNWYKASLLLWWTLDTADRRVGGGLVPVIDRHSGEHCYALSAALHNT